MRYQHVERRTGLHVEVTAQHKAERELVAAVEFELMGPIVRQASVGVVQQALKIEQRSDVRIRLPVVVAEQPFVVARKAREYVRSDELPMVRKPLGSSNFDRAIETLCAAEATRYTAGGCIAFAGGALGRARLV